MTTTAPPVPTDVPDAPPVPFAVLKLTQLVPHEHNVRAELGDLTELTASIKAKGVLQPLVVAPGKGREKFVLIAGHRRLAAARAAGAKELPCLVRHDLVDEADQIEAMVVENVHRSDLTQLEEGDAYQYLIELGVPVKQLHTKTGRSVKTIRERIRLAESPEAVRDRVIKGQVPIEHAVALVDFEPGTKLYREVEQAMGTADFGWRLQGARRSLLVEKGHAKARKHLDTVGVPVVKFDYSTTRSLPDLAEDLTHGTDAETPTAVTAARHVDCPGHAAYLTADDPFYALVCTEYRKHLPSDDDGSEESPEQAAARVAQEAHQAAHRQAVVDLADAGAARRAFLAEVAARPGQDDLAHQVLLQHLTTLLDGYHFGGANAPIVAQLLGAQSDAGPAHTKKLAQKMTTTQLVLTLGLLDRVHPESRLQHPPQWDTHYDHGRIVASWLEDLTDRWGYTFTTVEQQQLDAAAAARAERAEKAAADAAGDDAGTTVTGAAGG